MFYELDSTRVTLREYRWGTPLLLMPVVVLLRSLRVHLPGSSDDPNVESLEPFRVQREALPAEIQAKFQPLEEQLRAAGFVDPAYHAIDDPYSLTRIYQATYRQSSGAALAKIHYRHWNQPGSVKEYLFPMFLSCFSDGTYLVSSAGKADMLAPPSCKVNRVEKASVPDLWRSHCEKLSMESFGKRVCPAYSQYEMLQLNERHHAAVRDFHVERGVFKKRDESPVELVEAMVVEPGPDAETGTSPNVGVVLDATLTATLAEVDRLQNRKTSWVSSILILAVTVGVFFAVRPQGFDWGWLLPLAGVLFFHELGHLAAMWMFRYRNLRMFFIPFLGAAVTGKNYNVPGWKKAIVSLMGPFPGIALGVVLGIVALVGSHSGMLPVVLMLLLINAFNLLPILPLDGGWIMHTVLFSRHPVLDVAFRLIAALLLLSTALLGDKVLAMVGGLMLFSLPTSYRVAKVVRHLREQRLDAASPDARTIPTLTAVAIINELRAVLPANRGVKTTAQFTLQVFESLNARPPGVLASLAFIGFHGGTFLVAIVASLVFLFGMSPKAREFMAAAATQPRHSVDAGKVWSWRGAEAPDASRGRVTTIVADCASRATGERAYRDLVGRLPPRAAATLFGQTLLVTLPAKDDAARKKWFAEVERVCPSAFVDSGLFGSSFRLTCLARDAQEADAIAQEAKEYFQIPGTMHPLPPWSKEHPVSDQQRKARRTYAEVHKRRGETHSDPRVAAVMKKQRKAALRGDDGELKQLSEEHVRILRELEKECLEKLRQEGPGKWDMETVELCSRMPALSSVEDLDEEDLVEAEMAGAQKTRREDYERWIREIGKRLGQSRVSEIKAVSGGDPAGTRFGSVRQTTLVLIFDGINFVQPSEGAPALADWLARKGCVDLKYEFEGFGGE